MRGAGDGLPAEALFAEDARSQENTDQAEDALVLDAPAQPRKQCGMLDLVKAGRDGSGEAIGTAAVVGFVLAHPDAQGLGMHAEVRVAEDLRTSAGGTPQVRLRIAFHGFTPFVGRLATCRG